MNPGEGNGTPVQYSCLENPMDRGAWWAAVYGVAESQTRLKRLSSSSSMSPGIIHTVVYKRNTRQVLGLQEFEVRQPLSVFTQLSNIKE